MLVTMATSAQTAPSPSWIDPILATLPRARVAVFGDCCVDAYWWLDDDHEASIETGLPVSRVNRQTYGLGGAGNVAANVAALGATVELIGLTGSDPFGAVLRRLAGAQGIATDGLIDAGDAWQTMVYAKPMRDGKEGSRVDFGACNRLEPALAARLGDAIAAAAARNAIVVINQQVCGVLSDAGLVERCNTIIAMYPRTRFVVDARSGADRFRGAAIKINATEAARLLGCPVPQGAVGEEEAGRLAMALHARPGATVFLTRGDRGLLVADGGLLSVIPGIQCSGTVDPVGAGDSVVATLATALAVGIEPALAARLANCAAAVTVRKLHTTGTANPAEIRAVAVSADHLYAPELAEDARRARFLPNSEIEVVRDIAVEPGQIRHAIFDHDGTISTLRQGWEAVMEPMMVRAVLGTRHDDAPAELFRSVQAAVKELIDRTTGIQTLAQMQELVALVRRFGCVPEAEVLDNHGYKKIYNDALMLQVRQRTAKLQSGELDPSDFEMKGAVRLLRHLHATGVRLYLASGTDEADVMAEAEVMGYAGLFTGGIFGAVGNLAVEAKRDVMDRIMRQNGIDGGALMVVGDGPVEMREGRRRGALCIGIASDEPRRYGLDPAKRARVIRAGADIVIGDFAQQQTLLAHLGLA
jgi:rfaE bifunctional protein kinase chain/domain